MSNGNGSSTLKRLFTSSSILFVGLVFQLGLGFLARLLVARLLGRVNYGAVALGYTLLLSTTVLVLVGLDTGIGRFLPRYDSVEARKGILISAFQIVVPLSVVAGVILSLSAGWLATVLFSDPGLEPVLRVFGLIVPLAALVRLTVGSIRGMQKSLPRVYLQNIALPLSRFSLIAVVLALGFKANGIAWAYAASYALTAAIAGYYLVYRTPMFASVSPKLRYRGLLSFSIPLMITATMTMVFQNLDTLLLGILSDTAAVGTYNAVYPLATLLTVVLASFGYLFMPMISELHSDNEFTEMRQVYQVVSKWVCLLTLPVFLTLAFYPSVVIRNTFGPEYIAGSAALSILAIGFFTHAISGPTGNTLTAIGDSRTIMYDNIIVAVVNLLLNIVLIREYSIVGAAIATMIGYFLMNGLYLAQLYNSTGIHPVRRELVLPGVAGFVLWAGMYWLLTLVLSNPDSALLVEGVLFAVIYPVVILLLGGIESEDIDLLIAFEERVGVDLEGVVSVVERYVN